MSDNIIVVKLASGEELITNLLGEAENTITISTDTLAAVLQPPQGPQGKMGFAFLPWGTLTQEGGLVLSKAHVLYNAPASQEVADHYKRAFSKLALPNQGLAIVK